MFYEFQIPYGGRGITLLISREFVHSLIGRMAELWWIINKGVEREPVLTLRLCY